MDISCVADISQNGARLYRSKLVLISQENQARIGWDCLDKF